MLNSQLFTILNADTPVKTLLGSNPLRVFPWSRSPAKPVLPYAVYSLYDSTPENYIAGAPDTDRKFIQVNIYAKTAESLEACFSAIRGAIEGDGYGYIVRYSANELDADTDLFSAIMEIDFIEVV